MASAKRVSAGTALTLAARSRLLTCDLPEEQGSLSGEHLSTTNARSSRILHWTSYEKIVESLDQWPLEATHYRALEKTPWVVTEKIHGAHFCLLTDGSTIAAASRKRLLTSHETFFDYQRVLLRLETRIYQLFSLTRRLYPQLTSLALYGELFGGAYPHPEVPAIPALQPIQTGIYYTPEIEFCAFDLAISDPQNRYLAYDQAMTLLAEAHLLYARPLLIAGYQEALSYPLLFSSTLPALLGLPPLSEPNYAEGVVLKPLKALTLQTTRGPFRPLFKRKIAAFAEDKRFHQAQKWSPPPEAQHDSSLDMLIWEAFQHITENRLQSAISKIGYRGFREPSQSRQLFQLFLADVLEQLEINQPDLYAALTQAERTRLHAAIVQEVRPLLKRFFQQETGASDWPASTRIYLASGHS